MYRLTPREYTVTESTGLSIVFKRDFFFNTLQNNLPSVDDMFNSISILSFFYFIFFNFFKNLFILIGGFLEKYSLHFWVKVVRNGVMPRSCHSKIILLTKFPRCPSMHLQTNGVKHIMLWKHH